MSPASPQPGNTHPCLTPPASTPRTTAWPPTPTPAPVHPRLKTVAPAAAVLSRADEAANIAGHWAAGQEHAADIGWDAVYTGPCSDPAGLGNEGGRATLCLRRRRPPLDSHPDPAGNSPRAWAGGPLVSWNAVRQGHGAGHLTSRGLHPKRARPRAVVDAPDEGSAQRRILLRGLSSIRQVLRCRLLEGSEMAAGAAQPNGAGRHDSFPKPVRARAAVSARGAAQMDAVGRSGAPHSRPAPSQPRLDTPGRWCRRPTSTMRSCWATTFAKPAVTARVEASTTCQRS